MAVTVLRYWKVARTKRTNKTSQRRNKSIPAWFGIVYLPFEMTRHTGVPSLGTVRIYSWKGHALCDSVAERALWSRSDAVLGYARRMGNKIWPFMTLNKTFFLLVCPVRFLVIATVRDFLWNHHCYSLLHTTIQTGFHAEAFCTQNIHPINNLLRPLHSLRSNIIACWQMPYLQKSSLWTENS